ncbi:MAG: ATP-binding domain-containing protein, partial [Synergistaceae bacterium]|nr:ATP-binding domain-containing protein [Synergistaceae bacterium]
NGDIGFVSAVNTEDSELTVEFDDRSVTYDISELDELVLAYATTIHKSQGSEFPYVVMPLMMSHYMMLQRNLLYTGVTRAKKGLILVGEKKAIYIAVKNNKIVERNTRLAERLRK